MIPELLKQYPEGSDLTILNTYYSYPMYESGKKIHDDFIILLYKDNITREKHHAIIKNPKYTYYKIKDGEEVPPYNQLFIEKEKVEEVTVPYLDLEKSIAEVTGNEEFYKKNILMREKYRNKRLHMEPNVFSSDRNIEDHYRFKFSNIYTNNITKITKGFFDIEVDGKWAEGDFVEMGECAINCVSFYDEVTDTSYTFVLKDLRNPLIEQFEKEIHDGTFGYNEIHKFVEENVGGPEKMEKYGLSNTKYKIEFYEYEIELIRDLFTTMHRCKPDFIEGWNSSAFDLNYIIARIYNLGHEPADIMCDQSWEVKIVKNWIDTKNINDLAERGDYTYISGDSIFVDQMIQYASRRKAKIGSYKSFKLDDIGLLEAGVRKLDYSHITKSVTELPWLDFKTFVLYNIMDVIVQKCIESKAQDLEYIFSKAIANNTVYQKVHRQTVYLINRMASDWYKMGYIIGNNCNKDNVVKNKFLGALVGEPLNTNDYSKIKINGRAIWVCDNLMDFDFKALYPSVINEFNIAPNTVIGKLEIDEKVYPNENVYKQELYQRGGEFLENIATDNYIEFSHRWFNLASFSDVVDDIDEFLIGYSEVESDYTKPFIPTSTPIVTPLTYTGENLIRPLQFYNDRDRSITYESLTKEEQ